MHTSTADKPAHVRLEGGLYDQQTVIRQMFEVGNQVQIGTAVYRPTGNPARYQYDEQQSGLNNPDRARILARAGITEETH